MTTSVDFGLDIGFFTSDANYDTNSGGVDKMYHVVKLTATGVIAASAEADVAFGVLQNDPRLGFAAKVRTFGITKAVAGGVFAKGAALYLTAAGRVAGTADVAIGARFIGTALEASGVAGQVVMVQLAPLNEFTDVKA